MSASAKRYPLPVPVAEGMRHGVSALVRAGDPIAALLYARLCWDWADGVPHRGMAALSEVLGVSRRVLQTSTERLESYGLAVVFRQKGSALGYQLRLADENGRVVDENEMQKPYMVHSQLAATDENENEKPYVVPSKFELAEVIRTPETALTSHLSSDGVSAGYVTLCEFGTNLAFKLRSYYVVTTYGTAVTTTTTCGTTCSKPQISTEAVSAQGVAPAGAPDMGKGNLVKKVKRARPAGSAGFRVAKKEELPLDTHYAVIVDLHRDWCAAFGVTLTLTNWRYAAWRLALVEAGYGADRLRSAFPGAAADPFWRKNPDPHFMFGKNPEKIERYFPDNSPVVGPDRFAQRPVHDPHEFEF